MRIITLVTDFGLEDGYPGILKGVILGIAPEVQLVDLSHTVSPQNILEGALTLDRCIPYFPPGTIHLVVVDPGVGSNRRPIAARLGECYYVGPDNGLITPLIKFAEIKQGQMEVIHLDRREYWLKEVSHVFHGRDIFAPVSAHLANGVPLEQLGSPIEDPVRIDFPLPHPLDHGWRGQVIHIDHFGNVATNIKQSHLLAFSTMQIRYGEHIIKGLAKTYADGEPGKLIAIVDSSDYLSLCIPGGSAARKLQAKLGDPVEVVTQLMLI